MFRLLHILIFSFFLQTTHVYKTPSGEKYHLSSCRTVKNVSQKITFDEARELGLTACSICRPANIYRGAVPAPNKQKGQGETVQCKGVTKKGARCQHRTRIGNGYCFQHMP